MLLWRRQELTDEVTSRRQTATTLAFHVEQLLKQCNELSSSSAVAAAPSTEQTQELETLMDDVRHRLNTVSTRS